MREGGGREIQTLLAEEVVLRLTGHRLDSGLQLLLPGKDHGEVIFSFAQMNMNGVWEIIADRTPSRPRLVISRVSHNSILINGIEWFITSWTGPNQTDGQREEKGDGAVQIMEDETPIEENPDQEIEAEKIEGGEQKGKEREHAEGKKGKHLEDLDIDQSSELDEATSQLYEELVLQSDHRSEVMDSSFVLHLRRTLDPKREVARQQMVKDKMQHIEQKYHDLPSSYFNLLSTTNLDLGLEDDLGLD